ncbi:hypothetical protein [Neisseria sicca]|uniref:hypothetical protein n=1 Tax=Neisseria sicca TaxID=490 RepID=UPI001649FABF|nr:hypothetical protein [Neisseria sicca]
MTAIWLRPQGNQGRLKTFWRNLRPWFSDDLFVFELIDDLSKRAASVSPTATPTR